MKTNNKSSFPFSFSPASTLFPLFLFLSILSSQARTAPKSCSSSCGNITNIQYPFRLSTDPPGCGDPDYQISCENNQPTLNFHSGTYHIKSINYPQRIIRLVDANLATGACNFPKRSLSMEEVIGDGRYSGVMTYHHANFLRCSGNLTDPGYTRVPCLSGDDARQVFVNISDYVLFSHEIPESCVKASVVPTVYDASKKNLSYETISVMLEDGFDLGWSVDCRDCGNDGGFCQLESPDVKPATFRCSHGDYIPQWQINLIWAGVIGGPILVLVVTGLLIWCCISRRRRRRNANKGNVENSQQNSTA